MPALALRKTAWDGATATQRYVARVMGIYSLVRRDLRMGDPATLRAPNGIQWYVWDHVWFEVRHLSYLLCTLANVSTWPAGWTPTGDEGQDRETIMRWCEAGQAVPLKLPGAMAPVPDGTDAWAWVAAQCGAPAWILLGSSVPDTWVAVEP